MDTSEQNIKMVDCPEIQIPHWEEGWKEGDYFWDGNKVCLCGMDYLVVKDLFQDGRSRVRFAIRKPMPMVSFEQDCSVGSITVKTGEYVIKELHCGLWLPRQDQLQAMVINFGHGQQNSGMLVGLSIFSAEYGYDNSSMEQLWLAFIMKEKYGKVWNGEEWQG